MYIIQIKNSQSSKQFLSLSNISIFLTSKVSKLYD